MRHRAVLLALFVTFAMTGCAGNRAYLDWRPGITELDFEGLFEISLDEFDTFSAEAAANASFDRHHGVASPDAAAQMAALGEALADGDPRGYSIASLDGDGSVTLAGDRGQSYSGSVDWFAVTPDSRHAALLSGTKLAVAIDGATTGIDIGSLVGASLGGHSVMMLVRDEELTVFVLPELGGVVTANEPGFLFSFQYRASGKQAWEISVARVAIKM